MGALPPKSEDPVRRVRRSDLARLSPSDIEDIAARSAKQLQAFARGLEKDGFPVPRHLLREPNREALIGEASNIRAWLFNESRRTKETIVDFSGMAAPRTELLAWIRRLRFNRNTFDLSIVTHARAAQRSQLWEIAQEDDGDRRLSHVAPLVPSSAEFRIREGGKLRPLLGRVFTLQEWLRISRESNQGRRSLSLLFSLGLHHGDPHQLLPITPGSLLAFERVLREYRRRLEERLRRRYERGE